MTLLEHEKVLLKAKNTIHKKDFLKLSLLSSLYIYALASICYLIFHNNIHLWVVYLIATIVYIIVVIVQNNNTYEHYKKFFGSDELLITDEKIYYNVCMNLKGNYVNFDDSKKITDIDSLEIKKGFYPTRLKITFKNDEAYIVVHCLENFKEIIEYLSCKINQ